MSESVCLAILEVASVLRTIREEGKLMVPHLEVSDQMKPALVRDGEQNDRLIY